MYIESWRFNYMSITKDCTKGREGSECAGELSILWVQNLINDAHHISGNFHFFLQLQMCSQLLIITFLRSLRLPATLHTWRRQRHTSIMLMWNRSKRYHHYHYQGATFSIASSRWNMHKHRYHTLCLSILHLIIHVIIVSFLPPTLSRLLASRM